jgi:hypothetical protein
MPAPQLRGRSRTDVDPVVTLLAVRRRLLAPGLHNCAARTRRRARRGQRVLHRRAGESGAAVDLAAVELRPLLAQTSGVTLPIVDEDERGDGPALLLGASATARAHGLVDSATALGSDGVLLCTIGGDLVVLGGGDRGQLYAVYELAERFPDRKLHTLAYQHTLSTPRVTVPRDNVILRLCQHACYFHGIDCMPLGAGYRQALDDWGKVAPHIYVWHYGVNFWHYLAPNPNLAALAADLAQYAARGIEGVMVQCDIQSPGGELAELRSYLCAQLLWDPRRNPLQIRRDFCAGYYGPAADCVLEFLALMDAWAASAPQHIPMNGWHPPDVTPPEFVAAGLEVLDRASARAADDVQRNRVEKLMLPLRYVRLSWPERYGLGREAGAAVLPRVRRVLERNAITTISEGPPNAAAFLARMAEVYGAP